MDGLDFDLYEPLTYAEDEEQETLKSGRKRATSEFESDDIETVSVRSKRQRLDVDKEKSPRKSKLLSQTQRSNVSDDLDSDDNELVIDFVDFDEDEAPSTNSGNKENVTITEISENDSQSRGGMTNAEITQGNDNQTRSKSQSYLYTSQRDSVFTPSPPSSPPSLNRSQNINEDTTEVAVRYRRVLKRIPFDIPYLPVTCQDGTRLYLRVKNIAMENEDESRPLACGSSKKNLIANWEEVKTQARVLKDKFHKLLAKTVEEEVISSTNDGNEENERSSHTSDTLWVEKYKPKSFLDLLSLEAVNRGLLHWIKLWDKSVFGRDYLAKIKATREKYAKLEQLEKERDEKFQRKSYLPSNEDYDDRGRPNVKVALLSGDPGLGKTTLAHVIAKHAGYKIREINASDDRSTEVFRKALEDAQNKTEHFMDGKPMCLIIDEIDGSPATSVKVLIDFATWNANAQGKKAKIGLRRPVICICNDLYAPCLKELKKHAFIIQFPLIPIPRLLDRLTEVSTKEELYIDQNTLQALCQKSECDVRSCLSTLQFLKKGLCTPKEALLTGVGAKDRAKGIFTVWNDIFTLPPEKRYQDAHPDPSHPRNRYWNILSTAQNHGEYDKLFGGVFENYLRIKYKDLYLQSILEGLEWAVWFESMQDYTLRTQNYGLYGFLPMYFVAAHFFFARKDSLRIQFPSSDINSKIPKFQNTVKTQISETSPAIARFLDPYMLITDVYPAILGVIQPCTIRPVPTQIWTQKERDTLQNVVNVMLTYNLTYTQLKNPDTGAYTFVLDPDLEEMVRFKGDESSSRKPFPYAIKQLVAREIETEKMRRNDLMPDVVQKETFKKPQTPKPSTSAGPSSASSSTPKSKLSTANSKTSISIIGRDFFGRPILPSADTSPEGGSKKINSVPVYFRFKEGYSNAVRRFVKMKDL